MQEKISKSTKKRLLLILNLLENWENSHITSKEIALFLGIKDSLVRYDFSALNFPNEHRGFKNGYEVFRLKNDIKKVLKIEQSSNLESLKKVCIVGLGRLGVALLDNSFFKESGFEVCAGFDSSLNRVELIRSTFELFPASKIESVCIAKKIKYAIMCCPESETQKMADRLVKAGIEGIVNYTNSVFNVPKEINVQNASPAVLLGMIK